MPHWTTEPPAQAGGHAVRILRTPAAKPLVAIVTSQSIGGTATHFVKNRTIPCEKPNDCPWCDDGHSWRWHAYLSAVMAGTYEHFIFECTAAASDTFTTYYNIHNTVRGCKFQAHRPSGRANGRIVIACKRLDETQVRIPEELNVRRILCHIWNIKYDPDAYDGAGRRLCKAIGTMPTQDDGRYRPDGNGEK